MEPDGDGVSAAHGLTERRRPRRDLGRRLRLTSDSAPGAPLEIGPGQACIVRRGEWHLLATVEPALLVHITPGPRGEARPRK